MGGEDKGLMPIGGITLYQYVLARLRPQVSSIAISANRNQARYQASGLPVIGDLTPDFSGPLAGILAGLEQATSEWVAFVPCDVPDFPTTPATENVTTPHWHYYIPVWHRSWPII